VRREKFEGDGVAVVARGGRGENGDTVGDKT